MPDNNQDNLRIIVISHEGEEERVYHTTIGEWIASHPTFTAPHILNAIDKGCRYRMCYFDEDI